MTDKALDELNAIEQGLRVAWDQKAEDAWVTPELFSYKVGSRPAGDPMVAIFPELAEEAALLLLAYCLCCGHSWRCPELHIAMEDTFYGHDHYC